LVPCRDIIIALEDQKGDVSLGVVLVGEPWRLHVFLDPSLLTFLRPLARLNPTIPAPMMRTGFADILSVLIR